MTLAPKAVIKVNGLELSGWTSVEVTRSVTNLAGTFSVDLVESSGNPVASQYLKPQPGDSCEVILDGEKVITGYIEARQSTISPDSIGIAISGRSKTADLVDSSIDETPGEFLNVTPVQVIRRVAEKYGIRVIEKAPDTQKKIRIQVHQGETPLELIDRLTRFRGIAPHDNEDGDLVLDRIDETAGTAAQIALGVNIKAASTTLRVDQRASEIKVKGQTVATDEQFAAPANDIIAKVKDPAVKRYRPLILFNEEPSEKAEIQERADWEQARRAAESTEVRVTLQGWRDDGGKLWTPGSLYHVTISTAPVDQTLMAQNVRYTQDDNNGTLTEITLVPPEAFSSAKNGQNRRVAEQSHPPGNVGQAADGSTFDLDPIWSESVPATGAR